MMILFGTFGIFFFILFLITFLHDTVQRIEHIVEFLVGQCRPVDTAREFHAQRPSRLHAERIHQIVLCPDSVNPALITHVQQYTPP